MYNAPVRLALAIVVGLLTFSASGVSVLIVDEPCTAYEQSRTQDRDCAPTCVTCGCCAQAVEPGVTLVPNSLSIRSIPPAAVPVRFLSTDPLEVLHVPKLRLS
jgi:hypothetical protein